MSVTRNQRIVTITTWLRAFIAANQVFEVRALRGEAVDSHLYRGDHAVYAAEKILALESDGYQGIYFTPNPLKPELAKAAGDNDVIRRRWLLIDIDPIRPANTSSTEEEKVAAWNLLDHCRRALVAAGFEQPLIGDSGNGWHLCVPVDLPNDEATREAHRKLLRLLQARFGNASARIDIQTYNAARIWKIYGTLTRKGDGQGDRPWRYSRLMEV